MKLVLNIPDSFEGVLYVLLLDLLSCLSVIILFSLFRKKLVRKTGILKPLLEKDKDVIHDGKSEIQESEDINVSSGSKDMMNYGLEENGGFFSWISTTYRLDSSQVFRLAGRDALLFLQFQKQLCLFFGFTTILGLGVLLPVFATGENKLSGIPATTVYNLDSESNRFWPVVVFTGIFPALAFYLILITRDFQNAVKTQYLSARREHMKKKTLAPITVCVANFPRSIVDSQILYNAISTIYPARVIDAQIAIDARELSILEEKKKKCERELSRMEVSKYANMKEINAPQRVRTGCFQTEDAAEYYQNELSKIEKKVKDWKMNPKKQKGSGFAFITFKTKADATRCIVDARNKKLENLSKELGSHAWKVSQAQESRDIIWDNLPISRTQQIIRIFIINLFVFVGLSIFTPATTILSVIENLRNFEQFQKLLGTFLENPSTFSQHLAYHLCFDYIPAILMLLMSCIMIYIFSVGTIWERHYLKSSRDLWIMRKTFFYLILFTLIAPSVTLTVADALLQILQGKVPIIQAVGSFYMIDSGSFFINFMLTIALVSNSFELVRIQDFVARRWGQFREAMTREVMETHSNGASPFAYGIQYSWSVCIFGVVLMFSCFVPIILPIGFIHFAFKYFVDKHNLCLVCPKDFDSNGKMLQSALRYVVSCVIVFEFTIVIFFLLRKNWVHAGVVAAEIFVTAVIYLCISYRRKKFLKKKTRRIDQIYGDASTVEAQVEKGDSAIASLILYSKGKYVHPALEVPSIDK